MRKSLQELGEEVLPGLYVREIDYLRREEWAVTAEDILYRRSKLALHLPARQRHAPGCLARQPSRRTGSRDRDAM